MKNNLGIFSATLAITMIAFMFPKPSYAFDATFGVSSLVEKLAQKLGLTQSTVQTAFDTLRTERRAEMQKNYEDWLTQEVKDKKITEQQKSLVLTKHNEIVANREKTRTDLEAWAKQNNIDLAYVMGFGKRGMKKGMGMMSGHGGW